MPMSCDIMLLKASCPPNGGARVGLPGFPGIPGMPVGASVAVVAVTAVGLVGLEPAAGEVVVVVVVLASPLGEAAVVEEGGVLVVPAPGCPGIPACMPDMLGWGGI